MDMIGESIQVEYPLDEVLKKINDGWDTVESADRTLLGGISPRITWGRNAFNLYHANVIAHIEKLGLENKELRTSAIELENEVSRLRSLLRRSYDLLGIIPSDPHWEQHISLRSDIFEDLGLVNGE